MSYHCVSGLVEPPSNTKGPRTPTLHCQLGSLSLAVGVLTRDDEKDRKRSPLNLQLVLWQNVSKTVLLFEINNLNTTHVVQFGHNYVASVSTGQFSLKDSRPERLRGVYWACPPVPASRTRLRTWVNRSPVHLGMEMLVLVEFVVLILLLKDSMNKIYKKVYKD